MKFGLMHTYEFGLMTRPPYMTELFPFDNDMKPYNTTLSSYYTNDNASSTVSLLFLNTNMIGNDNSKMIHIFL